MHSPDIGTFGRWGSAKRAVLRPLALNSSVRVSAQFTGGGSAWAVFPATDTTPKSKMPARGEVSATRWTASFSKVRCPARSGRSQLLYPARDATSLPPSFVSRSRCLSDPGQSLLIGKQLSQ